MSLGRTALLLLLALAQLIPPAVGASASGAECQSAVVAVFEDGSIEANLTLTVTSAPVNVSILLGFAPLVVGGFYDNGLPAAVEVMDDGIVVYAADNGTIMVDVVSLDATSKQGSIWTLSLNLPCPATILLPNTTVPVSVEPEDFKVVREDGRLRLEFGTGNVSLEYIIAPTISGGNGVPAGSRRAPAALIAAVLTGVGLIALAAALAARRRQRSSGSVRLDERDRAIIEALRDEPKTAAEIMQATGIPRTPLYRRLRRLADEGVIEAFDDNGVRKYRLRRKI